MNEPPVIVGIGEVLWDVYPDAARFGGAPANFACHAAALGAEAWMVSAVGEDDLGERGLETLKTAGVHCDTVARDGQHETGQVRVSLDSLGQPSYEFASNSAWDHLEWSPQLDALAHRCDAVCFGTLGQRSPESRATILRFLSKTSKSSLLMFDVNLRRQFYDAETIETSLEMASALKLNEEELPKVADLCGIEPGPPIRMLRELVHRFHLHLAALTRGADGAVLIVENQESTFPAVPAKVVDTVGAGDAFTATLVVDFLRGVPLAKMNQHANAVASFVCSHPGAVIPLPAHLLTPDAAAWRVVEFQSANNAHRDAFRDLNLAWIEEHFVVEDEDRRYLYHPEIILEGGGRIFVAEGATTVLGVGALIVHDGKTVELAKMGVSPEAQKRGIGGALIQAAIDAARNMGAREIELYSNTLLEPAIRLYRRFGFKEEPIGKSDYARANIKMVLHL